MRARRRASQAGLGVLIGLGALAVWGGPEVLATPPPVESLPEAASVAAQVDDLMAKVWLEAKVRPAAPATDAEWLRRVSLDVTGAIPSEETVRAFLSSTSRTRRHDAVRALLQGEGYPRFTAVRWAYLLVGREFLLRSLQLRRMERQMRRDSEPSTAGGEAGGESGGEPMGGDAAGEPDDDPVPPLVGWLEDQLRANTPWDAVARSLLAAEGDASQDGSTHYMLRYARDGKAPEMTGNALRVFQGLQVQCAQCHDHPYSQWTQRDFWGVAAFFARVGARREPDPAGGGQQKGPYYVFERPNGQMRMPAPEGETGAIVLPRFLTGEVVRPGDGLNRRAELARLLTAPGNPYFARAIVNRVWSFFFGRGLATPVDDLDTAQSAHPEVLALLTDDFKRSGHDLRRLVEVILNTRAYGLSSATPRSGGAGGPASPAGDEARDASLAVFARAPLRSLSAEQLFYSVVEATGVEDLSTRDRVRRQRIERIKLQLLRQFLQTFGDDEMEEVVEEGTIPQALLLLNGTLTNDAIRPRPGHPVYERLFRMRTHAERVETIYLRVLGRPPVADEQRVVLALLEQPGARAAEGQAQAYADIYWALLNSSEFCLNH